MNTLILRWSAITFVIGLFTVLSSGCAVTDGGYGYGYGYDGGMSIGADYYEPYYGGVYDGWGPNYFVAPFRGGDHGPARGGGGGHPTSHAYRSAPASHSMPSIPSRSGGARSGGARSYGSRLH